MGELHLDIYVERIRKEYEVDATVGKPRVNFRETVTQRADFDYLHKKKSGGQGQYGRVIGYIEPLPTESGTKFEFENMLVGQVVPSNFIPAIEKGFKEAANSGALIGHPVENLRVVLTDGAAHTIDSSELAFKMASIYAFRQCYATSRPIILEPVMLVELKVPTEFQGAVVGDLNKCSPWKLRRSGKMAGGANDRRDARAVATVATGRGWRSFNRARILRGAAGKRHGVREWKAAFEKARNGDSGDGPRERATYEEIVQKLFEEAGGCHARKRTACKKPAGCPRTAAGEIVGEVADETMLV